MTNDSTTVSVVVPARNAAMTLNAQLEALAQQKVSCAWEVLISDNGSTDATRDVAERWAGRIPLLRVIDASARRGASAARNLGAAAASGELLLFCDADDVIAPGWVNQMAKALDVYALVGGVLENHSLRRSHGVSVSWNASAEIRLRYWTRYEATPGSNLGIRRTIFDELGGFDEYLVTGEDVDLCWRAQLAGHTFGRVRDAVVLARPRIGARAIYRQAYSYGEGHRQLRHKYAAFIAADADYEAPSSTAPAVERRSASRRLRRLFTASGFADVTWRVGQTLGELLSRADRRVTPLTRDVTI
ncbi:glycosyltransferase [Humibacter sp. RRB41]|uniref:glycosyltransferase n=1 Tax=Humibacter sp. RRB41 TaxID=2919946 RepID=UPI0027E24A39|nr:glycosyltransferase [Humibacter sp. RRB41]